MDRKWNKIDGYIGGWCWTKACTFINEVGKNITVKEGDGSWNKLKYLRMENSLYIEESIPH